MFMELSKHESRNLLQALLKWAGCDLDRWMMAIGLRVISSSPGLGQGVIEGIRKSGSAITLEIQYDNGELVLVDSLKFADTYWVSSITADLRKQIQQSRPLNYSTRKRKEALFETTIFCKNCGYSFRVEVLESELDGFEWQCPKCDYIAIYQADPRRTNRFKNDR